MKFFDDVREVWKEAGKAERALMVVTFPFWLLAAYMAYLFDTHVD